MTADIKSLLSDLIASRKKQQKSMILVWWGKKLCLANTYSYVPHEILPSFQ